MIDKRYKVFWIDDEHEKLGAFKRSALDFGIELIAFKSLESGISELEENYQNYDVVLLDALFIESDDDVLHSGDFKYSIRAKERILRLEKEFEIYVLTGQAKKYEDETYQEVFRNNVFAKGVDADEDKLFKALITAAERQQDTQIRHEYSKLFKALDSYDKNEQCFFLDIIKKIKQGFTDWNDDDFIRIRKIIERMYRKANKIGLLHDKCIPHGKVNLSDSSLFLSGEDTKHCKVRSKKVHCPKIIADAIKLIVFITGAAAHTTEPGCNSNKVNLDEYRESVKTPYLMYSLVFQLMDVILWFNAYMEINDDIEKNKSWWQDIEYNREGDMWEFGVIDRIAPNGWGSVNLDLKDQSISIYKGLIAEKELQVGDHVKIIIDTNIKAKEIQKYNLKK